MISGGNHWITGATALVLTTVIMAVGALLADVVSDLSGEIKNSEILSMLTGGPRSGNATTAMAILEPGKASSFLSYLNAMAPAVVNLEILPEEQLNGFDALYDAGQQNHVALDSFSIDDTSRQIRVICEAYAQRDVQAFVEAVQRTAAFSNVEMTENWEETTRMFTINCAF